MAYSHSRLRKTLALVRITTGIVFVLTGSFKVSSLEFGREVFPGFLDAGIHGAAATWVRPILEAIVNYGATRVGVAIGFLELFIGVALILGLAVRPAALIGMIYCAGLLVATWDQGETTPSMLQSSEHQFRNLFPVLVMLLLGVGHAGETWGVGALYHHHRDRKWAREAEPEPAPAVLLEEEDLEPTSFEEFAEIEARAAREEQAEEISDLEEDKEKSSY